MVRGPRPRPPFIWGRRAPTAASALGRCRGRAVRSSCPARCALCV
nr:MAG: hypothetical protein [Molluscum contagiosum virus]